jgi:hypothetical protein
MKALGNRLEKNVCVVLEPSAGNAVSVMPWINTSLSPKVSPAQQEQQCCVESAHWKEYSMPERPGGGLTR